MPSSKCSLDSFLIGFTGVLSHAMDLTDHWFHSNIHHTPDLIHCLFMLMFYIDCCKIFTAKISLINGFSGPIKKDRLYIDVGILNQPPQLCC